MHTIKYGYKYAYTDDTLLWIRIFTTFPICIIKENVTDSCIVCKKVDGKLVIMLSIHVDNVVICGTQKGMDEANVKVKANLVINEQDQVRYIWACFMGDKETMKTHIYHVPQRIRVTIFYKELWGT